MGYLPMRWAIYIPNKRTLDLAVDELERLGVGQDKIALKSNARCIEASYLTNVSLEGDISSTIMYGASRSRGDLIRQGVTILVLEDLLGMKEEKSLKVGNYSVHFMSDGMNVDIGCHRIHFDEVKAVYDGMVERQNQSK